MKIYFSDDDAAESAIGSPLEFRNSILLTGPKGTP